MTNKTSASSEPNSSSATLHAPISPSKAKAFYWIAIVSILASVLDHLYLMMEHYGLKYGQVDAKSLCNINETFNCAAVSASRYAELFGFPVALLGAAANAVLLLLALWWPYQEDEQRPAARTNLIAVSGFIALVSIVMGSISSFVIQKFCPFCMVAYILSFVSFAALWFATKPQRTPKSLTKKTYEASDFKPVAILGVIALAMVFVANAQISNSFGERELAPMAREAVANWLQTPKSDYKTIQPISKGAAADKAKMTITEFADFRCIHCQHAAPVMKAFLSAHNDVRLEFQAWPLDGECNTSISQTNGASCLLARAVMCAEKGSGKGWAAHDYIYENMERWASADAVRAALPDIAKATALPDAAAFATCADSAETKALVQSQASVGSGLNLQGTPSIYVNGKKLQYGQVLRVLQEVYDTIK